MYSCLVSQQCKSDQASTEQKCSFHHGNDDGTLLTRGGREREGRRGEEGGGGRIQIIIAKVTASHN